MACSFLKLKSFCIGFYYMLVILIYQLLSFGGCLFLSIVFAISLAFTFEFCWGYTLPVFLICFLQACLLIAIVKLHTILHDGSVGLRLAVKIREYPVFLNMIPSIFTMILSFGAYYQVYTEYYTVHIAPYELNPNKTIALLDNKSSPRSFQAYGNEKAPYIDNTMDFLLRKHGQSFGVFIICFSYLIYNVAKVIQKDAAVQLEGRRHNLGPLSTLVILFSLMCQASLTFGYSIPIIYAAIFAKMLDASYGAVFFYISAISAFLGIGASYIETKDPFPKIKNFPPLYFYECHVKSRIILLKYGLLPFVYYWFLNFYNYVQIPFNGNAEEHRFLLFTLSFAIVILQSIKIVSYGMLISRHPFLPFRRRRRRPREVDPDEQNVEDQILHRRPAMAPAQAVAQVPNPNLVDPTLVQDVPRNNNEPETGIVEDRVDTDTDRKQPTDTSASSKSSRSRKGKHRKRGKSRGPKPPSCPETVLMINAVIDEWLEEAQVNCGDRVDVPEDQALPGPSSVRSAPCLPSSRTETQDLPVIPIAAEDEVAIVNNVPADTVLDFNNND